MCVINVIEVVYTLSMCIVLIYNHNSNNIISILKIFSCFTREKNIIQHVIMFFIHINLTCEIEYLKYNSKKKNKYEKLY